MSNRAKISIEPDEMIQLLKREIQFKAVYEQILQQRIIARAVQDRGLTITAAEIQEEADRQRREKRLEKAADTLAWLDEQMITPDDWEEGIRAQLLRRKLAKCLFDKEVEKLFAQNRIDFEQVLLYQIVVAERALAQEILFQIEEGEISFYQAAHLYDLDEKRRQQCGYEGQLDRYSLNPDITAAIFSVPVGQVVGPLKTDLGYHLLIVEEIIPAELTPQRHQEILDQMFQEWLASELVYLLHSQTA
jgi:parvulin-like peptidyl-prolyl isomerase